MKFSVVLILFSAPSYLCQGLFFSLEKEDASFTDDIQPISNETVSSETSCFLKCLNHDQCCWLQVKKTDVSDADWMIYCSLFQLKIIIDIASVYYKPEKGSNIFYVESDRCSPPIDCFDWFKRGYTTDGVYKINVNGKITDAFCDMTTDGGGWTVFQKRINGMVSFDRTWEEYKNGFGDVAGEHWLGNGVLHQLTTSGAAADANTLIRLEGTSFGGETKHITFKGFLVEDEANKYKLHTGVFENGNEALGNSWLNHNQMFFSTTDRDNEMSHDHCGRTYSCGWWFNACIMMNPNGKYPQVESLSSPLWIVWYDWLGFNKGLKSFKMSLKTMH